MQKQGNKIVAFFKLSVFSVYQHCWYLVLATNNILQHIFVTKAVAAAIHL